jgi:hypothetical protein
VGDGSERVISTFLAVVEPTPPAARRSTDSI